MRCWYIRHGCIISSVGRMTARPLTSQVAPYEYLRGGPRWKHGTPVSRVVAKEETMSGVGGGVEEWGSVEEEPRIGVEREDHTDRSTSEPATKETRWATANSIHLPNQRDEMLV